MTLAIGFHATSGSIVIAGNGAFPARSLVATVSTVLPDTIQINDLGGRGEQSVAWAELTNLDGTYTPASMADALAYLQGEFAKCTPVRPIPASYPLSEVASFAVSHGLSYAPSTTIVDPDGAEVDTDVVHAPGLTTLTFAQPFTGTLYLG
ncbi:hypothetical protein [Methylobacterium sp. 1973]|uniref:hypothetical protein n=1 Tax=Methylobacterium sp. 1973 TaxID=3156421 RepID=UPI00339B9503